MSEHVITPPDETAINVSFTEDGMTLVTVARRSEDGVRTLKLTPQERYMLCGMLGAVDKRGVHAVFQDPGPGVPTVYGAGGAG